MGSCGCGSVLSVLEIFRISSLYQEKLEMEVVFASTAWVIACVRF